VGVHTEGDGLAGDPVGVASVTVTPPPYDSNNRPVGVAIEWATTTSEGRQLTVSFTGAPGPASQHCGADYTGQAVESANAVVVIVIEHANANPFGGSCNSVGAPGTAIVDLAQPRGEWAVLEVKQRLPVSATITT
jgi:hypothetical protein